jgi:hypothetical protein
VSALPLICDVAYAGPSMHTQAGGPVPAISLSTELPEAAIEALKVTPPSAAIPQKSAAKSATKQRASAVQQQIQEAAGKPPSRVASPRAEAGTVSEGEATPVAVTAIQLPVEVEGESGLIDATAVDLGESLPPTQEASGSRHGKLHTQ